MATLRAGRLYINKHFIEEERGKKLGDKYFIRAKNGRYYTTKEESLFWLRSNTSLPTLGNCIGCMNNGPLGRRCGWCKHDGIKKKDVSMFKCIRCDGVLLDAEGLSFLFGKTGGGYHGRYHDMQLRKLPRCCDTFGDSFWKKDLVVWWSKDDLVEKLYKYMTNNIQVQDVKGLKQYGASQMLGFLPRPAELEESKVGANTDLPSSYNGGPTIGGVKVGPRDWGVKVRSMAGGIKASSNDEWDDEEEEDTDDNTTTEEELYEKKNKKSKKT